MASGEVQAGGDDGVLKLQSLLVRRPCDPGRLTLRSHLPGVLIQKGRPGCWWVGPLPSDAFLLPPAVPRGPQPFGPIHPGSGLGQNQGQGRTGEEEEMESLCQQPRTWFCLHISTRRPLQPAPAVPRLVPGPRPVAPDAFLIPNLLSLTSAPLPPGHTGPSSFPRIRGSVHHSLGGCVRGS